jgi:Integrase zinc binding domain
MGAAYGLQISKDSTATTKKYLKEALCEAHNSIFGRQDATLKTYIKITSSYYWLGIYSDIKMQVQTCLTCQQ